MKVIGKLAVDSNAVIAYREGIPRVCDILESADLILIPAIVLGELLYGATCSARSQENREAVRKFLKHSVLLAIDEKIAYQYAAVRFDLKRKGRPIPENDIWIAATCIELNIPLLTNDVHFEPIEKLSVLNWTRD